MTVIDAGEAQGLVGVGPPPRRPAPRSKRAPPDNPFDNIPPVAYEQPIWRQPTPFLRVFMVSDPAALRRVLVDNVANYPKTALENRIFRAAFGDGLLSSEGDKWRRHRRIMAPSFDPRSVMTYVPMMVEASSAFADRWSQLPDGAETDVSDAMTQLTLEIISRTMFSGDAEEMTGITGAALGSGADEAFNFNLLDMLPLISSVRLARKEKLMRQLFAPLDDAMLRLIEARRANPGKDLLGRLVSALDEEAGGGLSTQEVRDEVLTIFVAGHETTASAMTFVWYVLAHEPAWEAKLHAELAEVLGDRPPTEADLPKLTVTRRIIEETMRLYPPAPGLSARQALASDELGGVKIPKGSMVGVSSWVLHRHRTLWDNPDSFDPDRFLPERSVGRHRFAYLPFGGGARICIGHMLAMTEATLILATLAQRFRLRMRPGHRVKIQARVTIRPLGGLPMSVERR